MPCYLWKTPLGKEWAWKTQVIMLFCKNDFGLTDPKLQFKNCWPPRETPYLFIRNHSKLLIAIFSNERKMETTQIYIYLEFNKLLLRASQVALVVKNPFAKAGDLRYTGSIPGSGRYPRGRPGNPPGFLPGGSHGQRSLMGWSP